MNCDKCGAELPENETICPECGRDNTPPRETNPNPDGISVRAQTVPQRPRTSYSDRRTERKPSQKNRKGGGKLRIVILVLVIAALLCAAFFIGSRILQNGQEEPNLEDINGASQGNDTQTGNDPQDQADAAADDGDPFVGHAGGLDGHAKQIRDGGDRRHRCNTKIHMYTPFSVLSVAAKTCCEYHPSRR